MPRPANTYTRAASIRNTESGRSRTGERKFRERKRERESGGIGESGGDLIKEGEGHQGKQPQRGQGDRETGDDELLAGDRSLLLIILVE